MKQVTIILTSYKSAKYFSISGLLEKFLYLQKSCSLKLTRPSFHSASIISIFFSVFCSETAFAQNHNSTQTINLYNSEALTALQLGILKEVKYSIFVKNPVVLNIELEGEVQKKVSGGFYGQPDVVVFQASTQRKVPAWSYNIEFDNEYLSKDLQASYFLESGAYEVKLRGDINGWRSTTNFDTDSLALKLNLKVNAISTPEWVLLVNSWLREIGLGDKIRVLAASRGPDFSFDKPLPSGDKVKDFVKPLVLSQLYRRKKESAADGFHVDIDSVELTNRQLFVYISTQLGRDELDRLETQFIEKHGISLWSRVFRKISLYTGVVAKDIYGRIPVWCDASELYESNPGVVYRHGTVCESASLARDTPKLLTEKLGNVSLARDTPKWLTDKLGVAAIADINTNSETFSKVADSYLKSELDQIDGTLEYIYRDDMYIEVIVRGVRGWVVKGNNQWEKIQLAFAMQGIKNGKVRIFVDGMLASGMGSIIPQDSKYTYSMEPEYASDITSFAQKMLDGFVNYEE